MASSTEKLPAPEQTDVNASVTLRVGGMTCGGKSLLYIYRKSSS
jgi:hypothetical protein